MKNLIVFDLDGVITSEESYWDAAGLTLYEFLYSPLYWYLADDEPYSIAANAEESRRISRKVFPEWLIQSFKARALNSNWDTCYAAVSLHLIALLTLLPEKASLLPLDPSNSTWIDRLREQIEQAGLTQRLDISQLHESWEREHPFDLPLFAGATGLALFERLDAYARQRLELPVEGVFSRHQPFWSFCQDRFQEWLLGDTLFARAHHGMQSRQLGKPGCIFFEEPLLPPDQIRAALVKLQEMGYTLGIASGRVKAEASKPLEKYDLWRYFAEEHCGTYDVVLWGEAELRKLGEPRVALGKPHAFHFQAAVDREKALARVRSGSTEPWSMPFIAVGDSTSDILGGRAAGGLTVAVLTGAHTSEARELLLKSQPDFVIDDMTKLPELLQELESLATIQKLQFQRRVVAEKLLSLWFTRQMNLLVESVRLTPRAVSLNSFNGFFRNGGEEYFFKTHVEELGVLNEYYHADLLDQAGYNIVRPLQLLREKERQMVIYPVVQWPVIFDLMRAIETEQSLPEGIDEHTLIEAERAECRRLRAIYVQTFERERDTSGSPIHQLFWHRLAGGRFQQFYVGRDISLPGENKPERLMFEQIEQRQWIINGVEYERTLGELIEDGKRVLEPLRFTTAIVGHGDAHFGNVFLEGTGGDGRYLYFDPAFAGHHSPLLDIVKPLFHNVFAMWMYFPEQIEQSLSLNVKLAGTHIIVEHNYHLTPVRQALLQVKQEELLRPLLTELRERQALPEDWQEIINLALMCCPLLTVDLFDQSKRSVQIGWLGLTQAVQLGNRGIEAWKGEL